MHVSYSMWRSDGNLRESVLSFRYVGPMYRILKSSGLATSTFSRVAILRTRILFELAFRVTGLLMLSCDGSHH